MLLVRDLVLTPSPSETGDSQPWMHSRITAELKKILMLRPHSGPVKSKCVCVWLGWEGVGGWWWDPGMVFLALRCCLG